MRDFARLTELVGNTPLARLRSLEPPGVEIYAKLEWFNPGGSVKDRAALGIIQSALPELKGRTLIDSTSGNTGVAYSWIGAALGVPVALVMPENVSEARKRLCRAFGAELIFSDPQEGSDGSTRLCAKLVAANPGKYFYADQYANPANPRAHETTTAREIWEQTQGRVTHFVAGTGTTGTVIGTGRGLRKLGRDVKILAYGPAESLHGLEGLRHMPTSYVPPLWRPEEMDGQLWIETDAAWDMAQRLLDQEGLLAGHSAGGAAEAAVRIARTLREGVVVTVFADRADRYLPAP